MPVAAAGPCPRCRKPLGQGAPLCSTCSDAIDVAALTPAPPHAILPLATTQTLAGHDVQATLGVVAAEAVLGVGLFTELRAGITDVIGGRNATIQKLLREAREDCLKDLQRDAEAIGANAVIGIAFCYSEFSGQNKSMLLLVVSGTAVLVTATKPAIAV